MKLFKIYIIVILVLLSQSAFSLNSKFGECGGFSNPFDKSGQQEISSDSIPIFPALGEFKILVIMVRFASQPSNEQVEYIVHGSSQYKHPDDVTIEMVDTLIFDNRYPGPWKTPNFQFDPVWKWENYDGVSVNDYFRAVSNDRMRITGEVAGVYVLDDLDSTQWFNDLFPLAIDSAIANGYNIEYTTDPIPVVTGGDWDRIMIINPKYNDCSNCITGGARLGRIVWINGLMAYFRLVIHELAHSFDIGHSNGWFCKLEGTWPTSSDTSCGLSMLADRYDPMSSGSGHFNIRVKEMLGWIDPEQVHTITESGTFSLTPLQTADGLKALRIPRDTSFYYYQFRAPLDFDEVVTLDPFTYTRTDGLYGLRVDVNNISFDNLLLDMPPLTHPSIQGSNRETILAVGDTYIDSVIGVSVQVVSLTGTGANAELEVDVNILSFGDFDGDGIVNSIDNCVSIANFDQADTNNDSIGDACCCVGIRGNIDGDLSDSIDISDLVFLVSFSFQSGATPPCPNEADINGDSSLDISDIVSLVNYSFGTPQGPAPVACP